MMKKQTVQDIIEDVKSDICDKYCKYAAEADDTVKLMAEHCDKCPLNRL
jgi:hypothetical protein